MGTRRQNSESSRSRVATGVPPVSRPRWRRLRRTALVLLLIVVALTIFAYLPAGSLAAAVPDATRGPAALRAAGPTSYSEASDALRAHVANTPSAGELQVLASHEAA